MKRVYLIVLMVLSSIFIFGNFGITEEYFKEEGWTQEVEELNQTVRENNEEVLNRLNKEINYMGRVTDQNGNPVSGVEITGLIEKLLSLVDKEIQSIEPVITDANGLFNIIGEGSSISLVIRKEGYYSIEISYNTDNAYRVINEVFSDIRTTNMFDDEMVAVLDENIIPEEVDEIVLIEKGQLYDLKGGCKEFTLYQDSGVKGLNLYRDQMVGWTMIPPEYMDEYADIRFEVVDNGSDDINDWQFKVWTSDEEGGFVEFQPTEYANYTDYVMRDAPEIGYQRELIFNVSDILAEAGDKGYIEKQYYFKLRLRKAGNMDGDLIFGKVKRFVIYPNIDKNAFVLQFHYAFNPDGTMHLEN